MTTNAAALAAHALETVARLKGLPNTFGDGPAYIDSHAAHTKCASCFRLLTQEVFDIPSTIWSATFSGMFPTAAQIHEAVRAGAIQHVDRIEDAVPGDFLSIAYTEPRNGFTGHTAIIVEKPVARMWTNRFSVGVVDSSRTHHGATDTRVSMPGGIGKGEMVLVGSKGIHPVLVGYAWSLGISETLLNDNGQDIIIGRIPAEWKQHNKGN